jgi:DNA-binding MarR family transcriptional regulator
VDHLCRVTECVNPHHVEPVTDAENVQRGQIAKLTPEQVAEIRHLVAHSDLTPKEIAESFGVLPTTVVNIVRRQLWRNVA